MKRLDKTLLTLALCCCTQVQAAPNVSTECTGILLNPTFNSGTAWSMCIHLDQQTGLTVNKLKYKSLQAERRVLGQAGLSQIETIFDDNTQAPLFNVTRNGLGGTSLLGLEPSSCANGKLYPDTNGRTVLCARVQTNNLLYKYEYQAYQQEAYFEIFSVSQPTQFQTYTQRWRFYESGVIEPALGFSGKIPRFTASTLGFGHPVSASDNWGLGFTNHLAWRLDFDLGQDGNNDVAEEITATLTPSRRQRHLATEVLEQESSRKLNPELKTTWRIKDGAETNNNGQAISYEIIPSQYQQSAVNVRGRPWLRDDIYFSRYHECEKFASDNPATNGCKRNVLQFTQDKEAINKADLVVWYKQNYHYLPRSDDSDYISTDWVSFQLLPRDWTASNPL